MYCLSCQYDLRNLTERRCPECGCVFDPADDRTFDSASPRLRRIVSIGLLIFAVAAIGLPLLVWVIRLVRSA